MRANARPAATANPSAAAADGPPAGLLVRVVRRQEVAFALVGVCNTLLGIGLTVAWLAVLGDAWPPAVSVVLAYCMGIVVAFVLHRTLVFRVRGRVLRDFAGFVVVNSGGLLMNTVLLSLAVAVLHLPRIPSAVVVMGLVAVASFFGHRYISFRRRPEVRSAGATG
ncbi:GtrA family protein [Nocardia sp. Marseille-Q1738]